MRIISKQRKDKISELEKKINYEFEKIYLLDRALIHSSFANQEGLSYIEHNERQEFLGDSVLSLVISEYIFKKFINKPEGTLTRIRANLVCENSLYEHAKKLELGNYLLIGKGEELTGGRMRISILADAYEAMIAAIFIDGGIENAERFILSRFTNDIEDTVKSINTWDFKSRLQEYIQKDANFSIKYEVTGEDGPDHNKIFYVNVKVNDEIVGSGHGKSKKEAEMEAARFALMSIGDIK